MDDRYLKRLFGEDFSGFNYEEAVEYVGVSFLDFLTKIQKMGGESKISKDIDLEAIYMFTLFCYYNWAAHPCKILYVPVFFSYLRLLIGYSEIEEVRIVGKPISLDEERRKLKRSASEVFTNNQHVNIVKLFIDHMNSPEVVRKTIGDFFNSFDIEHAELRNKKDFTDKRAISYLIDTKLVKLFDCLFDNNNSPQRKRDIMNLLTAFGLTNFGKGADLLDNYKKLSKPNIRPLYRISSKRIYLNSGKDKFLIEYSKESETEIVNYILNQKESIQQ